MKLSLGMNIQAGPWGGGNQFGAALVAGLRQRGIEVTFDLNDPELDIIQLVDPRPELKITAYTHHDILRYLREVNPRALVVYRVSDSDERKGGGDFNRLARQAVDVVDHVVWASQWLRQTHLAGGMTPLAESQIYNGVDKTIFHPHGHQRWNKRAPLRLVTHHWGGLWSKGFDIYALIDRLLDTDAYRERIAFTYIGNLPQGFTFQHAAYLPPTHGPALAELLRDQHVYITGAQHEPAGNHHMEGAACGLPVLYRESGGIPDYCAGFGLGFTPETFERRLDEMLATYDHWADQMPNYPHSAERMVENFVALYDDLLSRREEIIAKRRWPQTIPTLQDDRAKSVAWLESIKPKVLDYLQTLRIDAGIYAPAEAGLTGEGLQTRLPWSCLALKTVYTLGAWEALPDSEKSAWVRYIQGFQVEGNPLELRWGNQAFVDGPLIEHVGWQTSRIRRLLDKTLTPWHFSYLQRVLSAETKQAIATLNQVGASAPRPYRGFPTTRRQLSAYFRMFDWSKPWESGAHLATLAVFYTLEAPRFLPSKQTATLITQLNTFIATLADAQTGGYFLGQRPAYDELINGAMKVLTALDWLGTPIHHPERLIDTALSEKPASEGCHLVDTVYVLYRACQQTDYRRAEVEAYLIGLVQMLVEHYNPLDGGFSYHIGRSQPHFYRLHITHELPISDIHGTALLTWASAMILDILGQSQGWKIIKP